MEGSPRPNPWDEIFVEHGRVFDEPHESAGGVAQLVAERGGRRILDLGCGSGRHVVFFARAGFEVSGLDSSPEALRLAGEWLDAEQLDAELRLCSIFGALPYRDAEFDCVIGVQTVHHARLAQIASLVREVDRVLRPGGVVFVTVPLVNHAETFEEVEPGTLVPLSGPEVGLPHHYFERDELRELFRGYVAEDPFEDATQHLCLVALKPGPA